MNYLVVTLFNPKSNLNIYVYQKSRTEFKIKHQIGHNSYSIDYCWGKYELTRTCFCYMINGFQLVNNNLDYVFAHAVHTGDFSELEEPIAEPPVLSARCSPFRTAYEPETLTRTETETLTRTDNVILEHRPKMLLLKNKYLKKIYII